MPYIKPEIWRTFKVSGNITLAAFHDKVVGPVMGWTRNYHGYYFTDRKDGALIGEQLLPFYRHRLTKNVSGPVRSGAVDMVHLPLHGYAVMDDTKIKLADTLQAPGIIYLKNVLEPLPHMSYFQETGLGTRMTSATTGLMISLCKRCVSCITLPLTLAHVKDITSGAIRW